MSASPDLNTPGMSCSRAMRPHPICAIRKRLLGASAPNTRDGMISSTDTTAAVVATLWQNSRRVSSGLREPLFIVVFLSLRLVADYSRLGHHTIDARQESLRARQQLPQECKTAII